MAPRKAADAYVTSAEIGPDSCWVFPCALCNQLTVGAPGELCDECAFGSTEQANQLRAGEVA